MSLYFDTVDLSVIDDGREHDDHLAAAVRIGRELLNVCNVLSACGLEDVESTQYLRAVDANIERPLAGGRPIRFGEIEGHHLRAAGGEARDGIGEVPVTVGLQNRLRGNRTG